MATSVWSNGAALSGSKTVTTAGTAVALDSGYSVRSLTVVAKDNNTGRIYVGGSGVASTTNRGLAAGESVSVTSETAFLLSGVYIDASVSGEGVDFYASV